MEEEEVLPAVDVRFLDQKRVEEEVEDIMIETIGQKKLCMN